MSGHPHRARRADELIAEAQARGDFDELPGAGRPLRAADAAVRDEYWWIKQYAERENVPGSEFLPEPLKLRKELETLRHRVVLMSRQSAVRAEAEALNARIRAEIRTPTSSIPVARSPVDVDEVVRRWELDREVRRSRSALAARPSVPAVADRRVRSGSWWRWFFTGR
ncbi:DnaJ family domain-containing protein [Nakamurella leprariae]|uniref:DUF1992 domain-containing protein n=1 Tax=Nakamurella leprariae TaxID=2803911 RepID=A0A938YD75_9ACTN|nr:DUF1992 domain-containing protein [Nakamurella leprariae]MBM9466034.1 DUF1992 domain-containing protein [Nakamurella leprariae]